MTARSVTRRGLRRPFAAGAALLTLSTLLAACTGSSNQTPAKSAYTVRAIFDSATFVLPGLDVKTSSGVRIGEVAAIELTDENQAAVTFTVSDPGFQDFRNDAQCTIKPSALIGERYLSCEITQERPDGAALPGPLPAIASGKYKGQRLLPVEQTSVPIDPDLLLAAANQSVRERFTLIIRELGAGVAGRGDKIAGTLRRSNEALRYGNRVLAQLAEQTEMLKRLDRSADTTLASLNAERDSVSDLVQNGNTVARRLAARQADFQRTISSFADLLEEVGPTSKSFNQLAAQLEPITKDLNRSSKDLATILDQLPSAASRGEKALDTLSPTFKQARTVITSTEMDDFIERFGDTSASARATASVLGAALGDFRTTGGIDYFLDAIYGLAYSTNGRDARGSFLRANVAAAANCALQSGTQSDSCGSTFTQLESTGKGISAATKSATSSTAKKSSASTSGSAAGATGSEAKAADLLLGGGR